jgi:hypothetical protein
MKNLFPIARSKTQAPSARRLVSGVWFLVAGLMLSGTLPAAAQWALPTHDIQRNAMKLVRTQVGWLQNSTMTAASYGYTGYDKVWRNFQGLRDAYNVFKQKLSPQQLNYGANNLAELDAGLDIIQQAFGNCQQDMAAGRSQTMAMNSMCRVLNQGAGIWLQEFNKTCTQLQVGWR